MANFKKSRTGHLRFYLIYISLVGAGIILLIKFYMLPRLLGVIARTSPAQAEAIKSRFLDGMIIFFALIFLFDFYFWRIDSRSEKEAKEARKILEINPNDPAAQKKLEGVEKKENLTLLFIEPVFILLLGLIVGFVVYIIFILPLYRMIGTF